MAKTYPCQLVDLDFIDTAPFRFVSTVDLAITPEQLASRQLQGRYLALIRQIPSAKRAAFQKTAKEKGREAAIKEMQSSIGK